MSYSEWLKKKREEESSQKGASSTVSAKPSSGSSPTVTSGQSGSNNSSASSYSEWLKKKREGTVQGWLSSATSLLKDTNQYHSSWHSKDDEGYTSLYNKTSDILAQADYWRKQYAGNDAAIKTIDSVVKAISDSRKTSGQAHRFYSQWDTEDAYLKWDAFSTTEKRQERYAQNQARLEELEKEREEALKPSIMTWQTPRHLLTEDIDKEIAAVKAEMEMYERGNTDESGFYYGSKTVDDYSKVMSDPNYGRFSGNRSYQNPTREALQEYDALSDQSGWYRDANGDLYDSRGIKIDETPDANGNIKSPLDDQAKYTVNDPLGMYLSTSEDERNEALSLADGMDGIWEAHIRDGYYGNWEQLTEGEVGIYYTLLGTKGKDAAMQYLTDMTTELNRRNMLADTERYNQEFSEAGTLERIAMSLASSPAQLLGGATGFLDDLGHTIRGEDINPYSAAHEMSNYAQTVRSNQAQALDEATNGIAIPFINFTVGDLYQAGMSAVDMGVGGLLGGTAYGALMGMGAASSEARRLYEQGASNEQIAWGAGLSGAAEMVFEKYSIENLINLKDADTVGRLVMNALIQGGVEASEEGFTELANTITNAIVMGSESDWAKLLEENDGVAWKALVAKAQEIGSAAFSGFVSGGFGGTGSSVRSYAGIRNQNIQTGKAITEGSGVDPLRNLALDMAKAGNENSEDLTKQANRLGKDFIFDSNKNAAVGRLYNTVRSSVTEQNIKDISTALQEKGISKKDATAIAGAVAVQANGMELTKDQQNILKKFESNTDVQDTVNSILDNQESGINQRAKSVAKFEFDTLRNQITSRMKQKAPGQENVSASDMVDAKKVNSFKVTYEASEDGKTKVAGKEVQISGIKKNEGGTYEVAIGENESTDGSNVEYVSKGQALVFESYTNLDAITDIETVRNMNAEARSSIAMAYDPASNQDGKKYVLGANLAFYYGYKGLSVKSIKGNAFVKEMTAEQVANAYNEGRKQAQADLAIKKKGMDAAYQQAKEVIKNKTDAAEKKSGGNHAILENGIAEKSMTKQQRASYKLAEAVANSVGTDIHVYLGGTENGKYEGTTGEIWLNLNANHSGQSMMAFTLSHELVHMAKQWSEDKYQAFVDFILGAYGDKGVPVERLIQNKIDSYKEKGETLTREEALEEVICDSCQRMLLDTNAVQEMAEFKKDHPDLVQAIMDFIKEWLDKIREAFKGAEPGSMEAEYFSQLDQGAQEIAKNLFVDMVMDAGDRLSTIREAYGKGTVVAVNEAGEYSLARFDENTDVADVTEFTKHSYSSLAEAAGFVAVEFDDGTRAFTRNGEKVTEVTVEDIENSPIGAFINFSLEQKDISKADADRQKKMFADICSMACKTNDFAMTMQFVGSAVFTGMKANADKQYGTTYDFPSICTKTQAVIDVMSAKMVKLGRGLNTDEITEIYREVFASGNPVPCPECYVFSRWIGIGGLLDNIKKYQDYYGSMTVSEAADAYRKMRSEIEAFAKEQGLTFGKAKGALTSKLTKEFNKLTEKIEKATNQGEAVKDSDRKRLDELEPMMNTVKAMTWLENVYFADSALTKVNKNFRVPNEVLFDLNNGEAFATQYKNAWAFRTTQGAGYGKAITPYAEARLGEGILVTNNTTNTIKGKANGTLNNYFLQQNGKMDAKAKEALMRARLKQKNQAFIGGQRFQSTSDARYENASDYLLAALEMQAMHGMVQVYTKVDGAVPAFSAWNMSINQSLMPLGGGLDAEGNVKDTSVGGMSPKVAFANRDKHETAGTITIGVNDNHIRAMFKQWVRDFIIPYHASGGKADVVADFRSIQEGQEKRGKMVRSTDYSRTQSDKVLSDDVLRWQGKTQEEIDRIHALREARIGILTRGKVNMDVVRSNEFLSALFDKLHGGEWDGVKLAKSKVESQIYPNEFWNQEVSYEDSAQITEDYLQYCDDLGFLHRFSGLVPRNGVLVPVTGYDQNGERVQLTDLAYKYDENGNKTGQIEEFFWKVLTDRRMYDNDGKYLPQKVVTLNDTTADTVTEFAQYNSGRQYDKQKAIELAKKIAKTKYSIYSSFYSDFDAWDGKKANVDFTIGRTSDALKSIGMKDQKIKMHSGMVISKMNKHKELTRDIFRQIPELLEHPIIVQFSDAIDPETGKQKYDDSITVIGELYAEVVKDGKAESVPVLVALNLVPKRKDSSVILDFAVVKSAYTKDALQNYLNENSILYIEPDKKRTDSWLSRTRLSLPVWEKRYGSIRKIAYVDGKVKVQNRKHMTDMEKKLLAAGIIDEFGNYLKPVTSNSRSSSNGISTRALLANAFDGIAQTPAEKQKMREYRDNITKVEDVEKRLKNLRARISQLTKANGDKSKIADMNKTAKDLAKLIDAYDRKLLELEASKPLRDVVERAKSDAYQEANAKSDERIAEYRKAVEARFDRGIDSRRRTEMRHKVQNVVGELNQLLLSNDKKHHVPDSLKKAVADALTLVNMDTVGAEERAANYANLIAKEQAKEEPNQDKIDAYTVTMENILRQGDKMGQRLKELRDAYEEIQESDDPDIANAYDPVIAGCLKELSQSIGNTSLRNMSIEQLSDVYDMYRMVLTRVRDANKTLLDNIKESISNLSSRVIGEVRMTGGEHKYRAALLDPVKKFLWNNMKPVYAMEWIGSSTLIRVFNNVRAGEDVWANDVTEAREYYLDKAKKYGYNSWDFNKKYSFESDSDIPFELTLEQILSLYAYSKREQAHDHLRLGGFVFDSNIETYTEEGSKVIKYKVNTADAHQITPEILADITGKLSDDQKRFVDEMQDYLSTVMGAKGNEITMKMYGVKLFKEKFYFPLKSAKQFMFEQNEVSGEVRIKNSGFTNKVVAKANNPVILSNFMDVWSNHVNDMSMYHAFVLPLEDFNRVFNYNSPKKEGQPPVSVKGTIQNAYGPSSVGYVKQLITDLNGGARTDSTTGIINKLMGLYKKGAVFASLSVVVQQPSAIARAAALVDTKYFIGPKVDHKRHKALWDEVKKYAPVAIIKEMGYFDTNMGKSTQDFIVSEEHDGWIDLVKKLDVKGLRKNTKDFVIDSDYRDEVLSWAPAFADELAWCSIWEAVKRETKANNPGMDIKSEAFLEKAGARFTEVITKTQVYDSVLSRSANMRSKDTGMKMATAFMAEPTTSINMIADALLQGKRGNRKYCRAAIGAVIASQILNAILVSFVYAARDEEEDETYWEKYAKHLTAKSLEGLNPVAYIPFVRDVVSIVQGYDVERSDMSVISDLWKAIENLSNDKISPYKKFEGFVGTVAQIFGLPAKNIMRDSRAVYQTLVAPSEKRHGTTAGLGYAIKAGLPKWMGGGDISNQNQLYEAYLSGDKDHIARVEARFEDKKAISSAIRKALRDNDPRIHEAAIAWNDNDLDEYMRIAKEIIGEKRFVQDDVVMAIRAEASAIAPDDGETSTSKAKGLFTTEKFAEAIAQGDEAMANAIRTDIIQTAQKNGKTEEEAVKSFNSSVKGDLKELFIAGEISEDRAIKTLVDFCGAEQEDAEDDVSKWVFRKDRGFEWSDLGDEYQSGAISRDELMSILVNEGGKTSEEADLQIQAYDWEAQGYDGATVAAVREYNENCAALNVPKDIYLYIRRFSNNTENDEVDGKTVYYSAMKKVMAEINAQYGLSAAQKTAIAKSLGWSDKNIKKYKLW